MSEDWTQRWSDELEDFYEQIAEEGWCQHFHCGWGTYDEWLNPRAIGGGEGMCGKEWVEREGLLDLVDRARALTLAPRADPDVTVTGAQRARAALRAVRPGGEEG